MFLWINEMSMHNMFLFSFRLIIFVQCFLEIGDIELGIKWLFRLFKA